MANRMGGYGSGKAGAAGRRLDRVGPARGTWVRQDVNRRALAGLRCLLRSAGVPVGGHCAHAERCAAHVLRGTGRAAEHRAAGTGDGLQQDQPDHHDPDREREACHYSWVQRRRARAPAGTTIRPAVGRRAGGVDEGRRDVGHGHDGPASRATAEGRVDDDAQAERLGAQTGEREERAGHYDRLDLREQGPPPEIVL